MSGTIFGNPLIAGDWAVRKRDDSISDLNNWTKQNMPILVNEIDGHRIVKDGKTDTVISINEPTSTNGTYESNHLYVDVQSKRFYWYFDGQHVRTTNSNPDPQYIPRNYYWKVNRANPNSEDINAALWQYCPNTNPLYEDLIFTVPIDDTGIDYDPKTKTNRFSCIMLPNKIERLYYKFDLEPDKDYMFSTIFQGSYNINPEHGNYLRLMVTRDILDDDDPCEFGAFDEEVQKKVVNYCEIMDPKRSMLYGVPFNSGSSPFVYLYIDFHPAVDDEAASFEFKNIRCGLAAHPGLFYMNGPIYVNSENDYYYEAGDSISNIAIAYPGAWVWSFYYSATKEHHIFALSGNEFKLVYVNTSYNNGYQFTVEVKSEPIDINGRTYHKVHKRWTDIPSPDIISYSPTEYMSDDEIFSRLSEYVKREDPSNYYYYTVLDEDTVYISLGVTIGAVSADDVPSLFRLTDEEFHSITPDAKNGIDYSSY